MQVLPIGPVTSARAQRDVTTESPFRQSTGVTATIEGYSQIPAEITQVTVTVNAAWRERRYT